MQSTTTTRPAPCPLGDSPAWCTADHYGDDAEHHAHSTAATSEVIHAVNPRDDHASSLCIDVEQTNTDPRPVIVLHGTAMDETYTLDDAERIARQILAQVMAARSRQAVAA